MCPEKTGHTLLIATLSAQVMKLLVILFALSLSRLMAVNVEVPEASLYFKIASKWQEVPIEEREKYNHQERTFFDEIYVVNLVCRYYAEYDGAMILIAVGEAQKGTIEDIKKKDQASISSDLIRTYNVPNYPDGSGKPILHGPEYHDFNGNLTFTYRLLSRTHLTLDQMRQLGRLNPRVEVNISEYYYIHNGKFVFIRASTRNPELMGELDSIIRTFKTR